MPQFHVDQVVDVIRLTNMQNFYGSIEIKFARGVITQVVKTESIAPLATVVENFSIAQKST